MFLSHCRSLGLGKEGIHTLASEIGNALETYIAVPSNIEFGRRNTVFRRRINS